MPMMYMLISTKHKDRSHNQSSWMTRANQVGGDSGWQHAEEAVGRYADGTYKFVFISGTL